MIIGIFLDNLTFNHEEDSQSKVWFPDILDILFDSFTQWTNWIGKWPCNWRFNLWNLFIEETLSWAAALYGVELSCRCELIKGAKSRIAQEMIIRLQLHSFLCITLLKKLDSFLKIGFLFLVLAPGRAKQITGQVLSLQLFSWAGCAAAGAKNWELASNSKKVLLLPALVSQGYKLNLHD